MVVFSIILLNQQSDDIWKKTVVVPKWVFQNTE